MTEQHQPTKLESYAKIIEAYQNANMALENRSLSLIRLVAIVFIIFIPYVGLFYYLELISGVATIMLSIIFVVTAFTLFWVYMKNLIYRLKHDAIIPKYKGYIMQNSVDPTGPAREFYRYSLFREKLRESRIRAEDVKPVIPLLDLEHNTLSSYVAQKPFAVWIWTTTGGILATSATNWPTDRVFGWVGLAFFLFIAHYTFSVFIRDQRRQYELHRFLTWYEADVSEPAAPTPNRANPPAD